ncbi:MFS transporter [Kaarinaea lacus]
MATHIIPPVLKREIFGWAMYDFANSGYTTVVMTTIFSAYFVAVVAGSGEENGTATLLWTIAVAVSNALVVVSAPVVGAIADFSARKKLFLGFTTVGCVLFTASLATVGPSDVWIAIILIILSNFMFSSGENFIAAFLPEISPQETMGRISAYGWTLGYFGGLLVLGLCLVYVQWSEAQGHTAENYVPGTMLIVAGAFALASLPTFIWLRERAIAQSDAKHMHYTRVGFLRLKHTIHHARQYKDLFRFLITLMVYHCGINTVVVLAAVYAQEVMGFTTNDNIILILVVNITAAAGAFLFGLVEDKIGSKNTLIITLLIWSAATTLAFFVQDRLWFWVVANLVGIALGSSQSAGRAIVGLFSPPQRCGEFFGLWGLATKFAAIIGPLSYGAITHLTHGQHRVALLSTTLFFVAGLLLLATVNEKRGRQAIYVTHDT